MILISRLALQLYYSSSGVLWYFWNAWTYQFYGRAHMNFVGSNKLDKGVALLVRLQNKHSDDTLIKESAWWRDFISLSFYNTWKIS